MDKLQVNINKEFKQKIKIFCAVNNISITELLMRAITEYINKSEDK